METSFSTINCRPNKAWRIVWLKYFGNNKKKRNDINSSNNFYYQGLF